MTFERDLAADRAVCDAATPPPWLVEERGGYISGHIVSPNHTYSGNGKSRPDSVLAPDSMQVVDADFCAAAREGWPAYIQRVQELDAEVERLREAMRQIRVKVSGKPWSEIEPEQLEIYRLADGETE